jgi:UDP-N-acetylmuramoyl-L-alanyl-D-glutamate--2,6-diaminopimelate ligase
MLAVNQAAESDIILIAGKGHETYQIIGSQVHDFDDRLTAKEAILGK